MDQFIIFEALASSHIRRLAFQFLHCPIFQIRQRPCWGWCTCTIFFILFSPFVPCILLKKTYWYHGSNTKICLKTNHSDRYICKNVFKHGKPNQTTSQKWFCSNISGWVVFQLDFWAETVKLRGSFWVQEFSPTDVFHAHLEFILQGYRSMCL